MTGWFQDGFASDEAKRKDTQGQSKDEVWHLRFWSNHVTPPSAPKRACYAMFTEGMTHRDREPFTQSIQLVTVHRCRGVRNQACRDLATQAFKRGRSPGRENALAGMSPSRRDSS